MQKPTHPDRYAQFIRKPNDDKLDSINRFDGYEDFNSDKKIKMYHFIYNKKTKKISYKKESVSKIDAERKHMQGTHLYVDKEMNTKEENEILEKFLEKQYGKKANEGKLINRVQKKVIKRKKGVTINENKKRFLPYWKLAVPSKVRNKAENEKCKISLEGQEGIAKRASNACCCF